MGTFVVFSVFIHPVFSIQQQLFGPKAHGPGCRVGKAVLGAKAWPGGACGAHSSKPAAVVCWAGPNHLLVSLPGIGTAGQGSLQVVFYSSDQKTSNHNNHETPWCQAYKNLCHRIDFIQDVSSCPNVGDKFL